MIFPNKHINLKNSLLNVGAILINKIDEPKTVSEVWSEVKSSDEIKSFEFFVLGIDLLYIFGLIEMKEGLINKR